MHLIVDAIYALIFDFPFPSTTWPSQKNKRDLIFACLLNLCQMVLRLYFGLTIGKQTESYQQKFLYVFIDIA